MDQLQEPVRQDPAQEARAQRLQALGDVIAGKRDDAVKARQNSGIEATWLTCEQNYVGIDEANAGLWDKQRWAKPTSMQGPLTRNSVAQDETRSNLFIRLTTRYVDAGAAKISEIMLPIDDKPFGMTPTPVPDFVNAKALLKALADAKAQTQPQQPVQPAPQDPAAAAQGQPPAAPPPTQMQQALGQAFDPNQVANAQALVDAANQSAEKAGQRIYDWMVEAKHAFEMRKVIFDGARLGAGVLKGPYAVPRLSRSITKNEQGEVVLEMKETTAPGESWVDLWNCFPDPACGEDIQNGSYFLERDFMSPRRVEDLKGYPGYLADQIDKVLKEGPDRCNVGEDGTINPAAAQSTNKDGKPSQYTIWYFYGRLSREDFMAALGEGKEADDMRTSLPKEVSGVHAMVTLVNGTVVRAVLNPLEKSGRFPYRVFKWSRRPGHWTGVGVAEQAFEPQRMVNAATRAMFNNAGRSAGSQIIIDKDMIVPADGQYAITPDKLWYKLEGADIDDVRKAIMAIELPDRQQSLMNIIEFAFRVAEETTNIPLITQGQNGATTPDTYGAAALQNNNANQLLRSVAANCDDGVTEPLVNDYYEWLLLDPDVPVEEKGDFRISAHGSTALVERAIQDQVIQNLVEPSLNPTFGLSPERVMTEYLKSKRIDPRSLALTEEEKQKLAQQPSMPPAVMAAQIRAQAQLKAAEMANQTEQQRIKSDTDRDTVFVQSQNARDQATFQSRREELQVRRELAIMDYANKHQISLEQAKAKLADTTLKLKVQQDLFVADKRVDLHKHHNSAPQVVTPAAEPPGRAPAGEAFTQ